MIGRTLVKATPNKFFDSLDSHPHSVKNWGGWEVFMFYFSDCFEEQSNAGRRIAYLELNLYVNGSGSITSVGEERANLSAVVYL